MAALQPGGEQEAPARLVELQLDDFLHTKMERGYQWVRRNKGREGEERKELGTSTFTGNQETRRRICGTPASNPCSLGARIEVRGEGNERGAPGLLIESNLAGND